MLKWKQPLFRIVFLQNCRSTWQRFSFLLLQGLCFAPAVNKYFICCLDHGPSFARASLRPFSLLLCSSTLSLTRALTNGPLVSRTNLCLALTAYGTVSLSHEPNTSKGPAQVMPPPRTETFYFFNPTLALPESTCVLFLFINRWKFGKTRWLSVTLFKTSFEITCFRDLLIWRT